MIKNIVNLIFRFLLTPGLKEVTELEKKYLTELLDEVKDIPFIDTKNLFGAELEWSNNVNDIIFSIMNKNPREFLSWEVIRYTMFVDKSIFVRSELNIMKESKDFQSVWKPVLKESLVGKPIRYWNYFESSGNLIHHTYHLYRFSESTSIKLKDLDFVFEFGGGYGSMCRAFDSAGFNKKYVIFDLPVFSSLQRYYLKSLGIKVLTFDNFFKEESGVLCISDLCELDVIFKTKKFATNSLFIATWSLSETPLSFREKIKDYIPRFNNYLFAYKNKFNDVDNVSYFENIAKQEGIIWHSEEISQLPGHKYLFGKSHNIKL
jgi:hypothetical protein